jgi:hypothetical protein
MHEHRRACTLRRCDLCGAVGKLARPAAHAGASARQLDALDPRGGGADARRHVPQLDLFGAPSRSQRDALREG